MNVLVLTRNVLAETDFQNKVQSLNHEVYCSKSALEQLTTTRNTEHLRCFPLIILSETMLNEEVREVTTILKKSNKILLRKTADLNDKKEQSELTDCSLDGWIRNDCSKTFLREELAAYQHIVNPFKEQDFEEPTESKSEINTLFFLNKLTTKERIIFQKLYSERGKCVDREELYAEVWSDEPTKSKVVQLSTFVKKIRKKIEESNSVEFQIITDYGHGYKLA